jgi:hypothetical protein
MLRRASSTCHLASNIILCLSQFVKSTQYLIMEKLTKTILFLLFLALMGCNTIKTEHTVKITMDVNVKLDRELDDFFSELDDLSEASEETTVE